MRHYSLQIWIKKKKFFLTMLICVGEWLTIDETNVCYYFRRSYYLSFLRERKDGPVTLYDFHLNADVFNTSREENSGFCGYGPCLGDGVLNISTCYSGKNFIWSWKFIFFFYFNDLFSSGVWGFISSPHFFQADEKFRRDVHGMSPDSNKHEFIMSFDPVRRIAQRWKRQVDSFV